MMKTFPSHKICQLLLDHYLYLPTFSSQANKKRQKQNKS